MPAEAHQIQLKPGEWPPEENGRWIGRIIENGHITGMTKRSYATKEDAIAACSAPGTN